MPTSSAGRTSRELQQRCRRARCAGITLIELLVVVALISLMVGISYPAITSGIDSLRLNAATNGLVSFINAGLSRAQRRQEVVEITVLKADNALEMHSSEPGFARKLQLPDGIAITQVLPLLPENPEGPRNFLLFPGGTVPPLGVQLVNRRNVERVVRVDPMTGVPRIEIPQL
jgi:prepilin-type N-terminal cleavage/methylation domain-containing protein